MNYKKLVWTDETSYSQSDHLAKEKPTPKTWTMYFDDFRLTVHRHRDYNKYDWLLTVHGSIEISTRLLRNPVLEFAKKEAFEFVSTLTSNASKQLDKVSTKE